MKTAITSICILLILSFKTHPGLHDFSFTTMEGEMKSFSVYAGKKILIVVLPGNIQSADTSYLEFISYAAASYRNKLAIIAVPSYEDGYTPAKAMQTKLWYKRKLGPIAILTQPMYTRKSSTSQNVIFSWLTDKDKNQHFDEDVSGPGQSFLINESGELYGLFDSGARLNQTILHEFIIQ